MNTTLIKSNKRPYRLAIVTDAIYPFNKGGKEVRIYQIAKRLAASGVEVHVYTMKWWEGPSDRKLDGMELHAISKLHPLYAGERRSIKQGILFGIAGFKLLFKDFDSLEVDHMPFFPIYSLKIVSIFRGKPMTATWHEVWGKAYWKEYLGSFKGTIAYLIERYSVNLPTAIIAVSGSTAEKLKTVLHCHRPIHVVENGVDAEAIASVRASDEKSDIIFVGRLLAHKNVAILIDAFKLLIDRNHNLRLSIVGDGPEITRLKHQVAKLKLNDRIKLYGFVNSHSHVFSLMKASKVFVLPSSREGYGITVLEANALGLPVITLSHPDNAAKNLIVPGVNGLVCELNVEDIADKILTVLGTSASFTPAKSVRRYNWQSIADQAEKVLI